MLTKEAALRTKLIRLAHAKPELRDRILPLLASGQPKRAALLPEDERAALLGLQALAKAAKLPFAIRAAKTGVYEVPVPKGLSSLFESLRVEVTLYQGQFSVGWRYDHNLGSNGYSIGWVAKEEDTGRWYWRSKSGQYGYVF